MTAHTVTCPDNIERPYYLDSDGKAVVMTPAGSEVKGTIAEVAGVMRFRPDARHHGAHLMWYPKPSSDLT